MAMELNINLKQSQVMIMTPQLQFAIKLLQLNQVELTEEIYQEMMENPLLELTPPGDSAEAAGQQALSNPDYDQTADSKSKSETDQFAEVAGETKEKIQEEIDWENYFGEYSSSPSLSTGSQEIPEEQPSFDTFTAARTSLSDHLTWQLSFSAVSKADFARGEAIIGNLNEDGYLVASLEELAQMTDSTTAEVSETLARVQEMDPAGVGARNLAECLLLQLRRLGQEDSMAAKIVGFHLRLLEKKDLPALCKALQADKEQVALAIEAVRALDPRPARAYAQNDPIYVTPDVFVNKVGDEYVITLNDDGLPRLKFNKAYRRMLTDNTASEETKKYLKEKLKGAQNLIRGISQRQKTIYRVAECIFRFQLDFLDKGVDYLKPLVLKDVAEELGCHESTISRVTTNKYVGTPRGVFELKYFFDNPISRFQGDSLSSESVKNRIKQIISGEDHTKPLSDQRIVEILHGSNINIARRTVAKYRELLGLGSSAERKEMF
ncbi:MAG: RNA polymerase factor sigma-54 [Deltaproteobacteria bacterium]|jgi:RNA polymerase sigma-54 factor|nr:RNA polymerase factor sigma-54 [Deltaproteobacteria bacterium]